MREIGFEIRNLYFWPGKYASMSHGIIQCMFNTKLLYDRRENLVTIQRGFNKSKTIKILQGFFQLNLA